MSNSDQDKPFWYQRTDGAMLDSTTSPVDMHRREAEESDRTGGGSGPSLAI